jgi:ribonuclease Z
VPAPSVADVMEEARRSYDGPMVAGEDLMRFEVGDTVSVQRAAGC